MHTFRFNPVTGLCDVVFIVDSKYSYTSLLIENLGVYEAMRYVSYLNGGANSTPPTLPVGSKFTTV